jgi:hypothetical protein
MAALGILNSHLPVEIMTMKTLVPLLTAALAKEGTDGKIQQIQLVTAANGTRTTQHGVVTMMMRISQLQNFAQPAGSPMLSFKESSNHIQWSTYRKEHSQFPLLDSRKSH